MGQHRHPVRGVRRSRGGRELRPAQQEHQPPTAQRERRLRRRRRRARSRRGAHERDLQPGRDDRQRERRQRRRPQPRRAAPSPQTGTTTHAAVAGSAGLVDTGNGVIVTGALTGDSPCELSGPPASAGQAGKDAEGHDHRGPFKQVTDHPGRGARAPGRADHRSRCRGQVPDGRDGRGRGLPQVHGVRAVHRRALHEHRARRLVQPGDAVGAALRRHQPRLEDRRPQLPRVPPQRRARRASPDRTTVGTSTTSTAGSASVGAAWSSAPRR